MTSKIVFKISKLTEDELLESMDTLVMQLEQRFGVEETDELLYQLVTQRVTFTFDDKTEQLDHFCLDLEQVQGLEELKPTLHDMLASIEVQLGRKAAEKIMHQIIYRLGVRNGKYDEYEEDDTSDDEGSEYYDDEDYLRTTDMDMENKYATLTWQPLRLNKNLHNDYKDDDKPHSMECNDEEMNRANEEYEQRAKY